MPKTRQTPNISYSGGHRRFLSYLYHQALEVHFLLLALFALLLFLLIGMVFSGLYMATGGLVFSMNSVRPLGLFDAYFFSVTFPVIGFGGIAPVGWGRIFSVFQIFIGLLYLSSLTGLIFARISKAKSPLVWSSPIVLHREKDRSSIQVRVTNILGNDVVNVNAALYLQKIEKNSCGDTIRKLIPVPLELSHIPLAAFSWILSHTLDASSPLKNWKNSADAPERLIGFIHGYDTTLDKEIFSYGKWSRKDLVAGTFDKVILNYRDDDDLRVHIDMDLAKMDSVIPEK
jgi:inward rectifier potassium channel